MTGGGPQRTRAGQRAAQSYAVPEATATSAVDSAMRRSAHAARGTVCVRLASVTFFSARHPQATQHPAGVLRSRPATTCRSAPAVVQTARIRTNRLLDLLPRHDNGTAVLESGRRSPTCAMLARHVSRTSRGRPRQARVDGRVCSVSITAQGYPGRSDCPAEGIGILVAHSGAPYIPTSATRTPSVATGSIRCRHRGPVDM